MDRSPAVVRGRSRVCAVAVAAAVAGALPGAAATCAAPWSVPSMKPSFSPRLVPLMVDCSAQICTKSHAPEKNGTGICPHTIAGTASGDIFPPGGETCNTDRAFQMARCYMVKYRIAKGGW